MSNMQGTSGALNNDERHQLLDIVGRLSSSPATVDSSQLATARNLAARAGFKATKIALDQEIHRRGDGAQDPDALRAALRDAGAASPPVRAPLPSSSALGSAEPEKKPLWPFVIGAVVLIGGLSYMSHKGHREIAARIEREHRVRAL